MPSRSAIERFVGMVESGQGVEALMQFYADDATMQENFSPPRVGKQALLTHEQAAQASVRNPRATCLRPILISGDTAVVRWIFEYETSAGKPVRFEELAHQWWDGDLIVKEQFFYDPGQFN